MANFTRILFALPLLVSFSWVQLLASDPPTEQMEFFETEIRPLLAKRCFECHGDQDLPEAGLRLTSRASILKGGESGAAAVPGKLDGSLLIEAVRYRGLEMPPQGKLPAEDIAKFEQWVEMGLPWPEEARPVPAGGSEKVEFNISDAQRTFWSFQPIVKHAPPPVNHIHWPKGEVDRFILAKLESHGLTPAAATKRRLLLRRVTFDLIGLPPTPEEIRVFVADESPDAFEKVVDRLLASRQYGERWGRHWLDVVRYADTAGDVADYPVPQAYRYRNYVVDAFNSDKPYNQFLREQLCGDLMAKEAPRVRYAELTTATGFIAITRRFGYNRTHQHHLTISDTLDTVGKALLGLSIGCARCHDHKFDPISSADYYALYGIFASTVYPFPGAEEQNRPQDFVPLVPPDAAQARVAEREKELAPLDAELKSLGDRVTALNSQLAAFAGGDVALKTQIDELVAKQAALQARRNELAAKELYPTAYAVADGQPQNAVIHRRGEPERPGAEVPRQFLEILGGQRLPADLKESGRRQLAEWIVDPANPLTARVIVNRVWQHHFGRGIVRTPSDFGTRGAQPTHPKLLDYLAATFMEDGWSLKRLHKRILLSSAYQMASADRADARRVDPRNDCFWRMDPRRFDAECIRDSVLAVSGQLDESKGEEHPFPATATWTFNVHHPFKEVYDTNRRSIYLMTQRLQKHPFLGLFDGADPGATTDMRMITTTPSQALFMMNDPFIHEQSAHFAKRLLALETNERSRVNAAFELTFGRPASAEEIAQAEEFQAGYRERLAGLNVAEAERSVAAWAAYLRTMLSSNEFLYVD